MFTPSRGRAVSLTIAGTFIVSLTAVNAWGQQPVPEAPQSRPQQPIRLEPTVVTATRTERSAAEVPEPVIVISPQEIKDAPAQTVDDLIRNVPGMNLSQGSSIVTHPTGQSVGIRGIGSNRALVLVDGVPINDAFGGWVNWSKIPLAFVDHIEVVKGGGSSLWGTYAMGGVINIITKVPEPARCRSSFSWHGLRSRKMADGGELAHRLGTTRSRRHS